MPSVTFRPARRARNQKGFTLLEMLVVILLSGMITLILFEGLNQVFRLETHFKAVLEETRRDAMVADWFRQVLIGLQPDYEEGEDQFSGTEQSLRGLTVNPLNPDLAVAPFSMALVYDGVQKETRLEYQSEARVTVLLRWPGQRGRFLFLDGKRQTQAVWPPRMADFKTTQIPRAIVLEAYRQDRPWQLVVAPMSPDRPRVRIEEIFGK